MKVGLARVSSVGQNLERQIIALKEYGCEKIFEEKVSENFSDNEIAVLKRCLEKIEKQFI